MSTRAGRRLALLATLASACAPGDLFGPAEARRAAGEGCPALVVETAAPRELSEWMQAQYPRLKVVVCLTS